LNGYKYGISDNKLVAALVIGFIATQIATLTGFWHEMINFPVMDWNRFNGTYLVGEQGASDFETFVIGWLFHTFTGIILTMAFIFLIRDRLPIPYTMTGNLMCGVAWGLVLALTSALIITPVLDPYHAAPGFLSLDLKLPDPQGGIHPGWKTPIAILLWHLSYGLQLGSFYSPSPETAPARERATAPAPSAPMGAAASAGGGGGGGGS
jgi:hypothetical protein